MIEQTYDIEPGDWIKYQPVPGTGSKIEEVQELVLTRDTTLAVVQSGARVQPKHILELRRVPHE